MHKIIICKKNYFFQIIKIVESKVSLNCWWNDLRESTPKIYLWELIQHPWSIDLVTSIVTIISRKAEWTQVSIIGEGISVMHNYSSWKSQINHLIKSWYKHLMLQFMMKKFCKLIILRCSLLTSIGTNELCS